MSRHEPKVTLLQIRDAAQRAQEICSDHEDLESLVPDWKATAVLERLIEILQDTSYQLQAKSPGIVHFFSGTKEDAKKLLDMGFSFSFGGVITFARDYDEVIKYIPLERIVLETDAPYVAPVPYRGKRNEPLYVEETAKKIADIRDINFDEIARIVTENAKKFLN